MDKLLARESVSVPTMLVDGLWDQEDIYGTVAVFKALTDRHAATAPLFLVLGPWYHHQPRVDGSHLGPIDFGSDTAAFFRQRLLRQFLDHFLTDEAPPLDLSPVSAFETGTNRWVSLPTWPSGCAAGCSIERKAIYLRTGGGLGFGAVSDTGVDSYVSDPRKPVPYLPRPISIGVRLPGAADAQSAWDTWLVSDQRDAAARPDVLSFTTEPLADSLKISGEPIANLRVSTTGTDGDFVVKLIDVYPDEVGRKPQLGGYQLMVAADIFRGRYWKSFAVPSPLTPGKPQVIQFGLPTTNHVFLPGHRVMVQILSTWFPLYDRNPQTYVRSIFDAKPADYRKSTIKVFEGGANSSFVEVPVVVTSKGP